MKWYQKMNIEYGSNLSANDANLWQDGLKSMNVTGDEVCEAIDHISSLDYIPRADKERKTARYNLRDLKLWIYIHRKETRRETETLPSDSEMGYRQFLLGKVRYLWESNRKIEAWRAICTPELVDGVNPPRAPTMQDSDWVREKAFEQFGYDAEEVFSLWMAEGLNNGHNMTAKVAAASKELADLL